MAATTETNSEKLTRDLGVLVRDGEELLKSGAHRLGEEAREKLEQAVDVAKATGLKLKQRAWKGAKAADRSVRNHPYQFLGVALGLGVLLAIFARRR
jgi:ElaB/YqjD/DUF883 family membrane-anchored ribosome-binding protein